MKSYEQLGWAIPVAALLSLPLACGGGGGGGGGDGETTVAASSTQVGQAVLVAMSAIDATGTAIETGTGAVSGSSLSSSSVEAAAMGMRDVMPSAHEHFRGMGSGPGQLDLTDAGCRDAGFVDTHMEWMDLDPDTLCVDDLDATFMLDDCTVAAGQTMHGQMGMTFTGATCDPERIAMDFSAVTVDTPDGTLSGAFTMILTGMMVAGDPAELDISGAVATLDGRMQMVGSGLGAVTMDMDHLAFHFDDATATGDLNGTLTVHCSDQAFPMSMATDANGLALDAEGNVVAGHMTVTSGGTTHTVVFQSAGSIDVAPAGEEPIHLTEPAANDFCNL